MKRVFLVLFVLLAIPGCSALTLGDPWEPMKTPYNMAVIYIYSDESMPTGQEIHYDNTPATPDAQKAVGMVSGGYYPLLVPTGAIRLFTGNDENGTCVEAVVQSDTEYFVRVSQDDDTPTVSWVHPSDGTSEIASHRRMAREMAQNSAARFGPNCVQPSF